MTQRRKNQSFVNIPELLSSVLVTRNIALRKDAFMPTRYEKKSDFGAGRGVDGDETSHFHTNVGNNTWWAVDLGEGGARVTTVRVVNRKTCGESATQLDIELTLAEMKIRKGTLGVIITQVATSTKITTLSV